MEAARTGRGSRARRFEHAPTELALIDLPAAVDGLTVVDRPSFGTFRPGARVARRILGMEG